MPNWVYNELYITGHEIARAAFRKQAMGEYKGSGGKVYKADFMFRQFFPPPSSKLLGGIYALEKGGGGWPLVMKWQADNWGCSKDVGSTSQLLRETKSSLVYGISTAWAPPIEFVRRVSVIYHYLHFSMHSWGPDGGRCIRKFAGGEENRDSLYDFKLYNFGKLPRYSPV